MDIKNLFGNFFNKKEENFLDKEIVDTKEIDSAFIDNMWKKLISEEMKNEEINECENRLKELLVYEQELKIKIKKLPIEKKKYLTEIINLTPDKFDENNDKASEKMEEYKENVERINAEIEEIKNELKEIVREKKKQLTDELQEACVKVAYETIVKNRSDAQEASKKIETLKEQLNVLISEKNRLEQNADNLYQYLHSTLGPVKVEEFDKKYLER